MAVPIIATGRILAQYAYNKIVGRPSFPPEVESPLGQVEIGPTPATPEPSVSSVAEDEQVGTEHLTGADSVTPGAAHDVESTAVEAESVEG